MRTPFLIGATIATAWASPAPAPVLPAVARAFGIPRRLPGKGVGLTFDDGPHPEGTPAVLDVLERAGARATFFVVGEQVEREPALTREIADAGHSLALHGHRHRNMLRLTPSEFAADLDRGSKVVEEAAGLRPRLYRPPYGIFSAAGLRIVRRRRLRILLWSRWGHDWRARITPAAIAAELSAGIAAGDVLLLHDADHYSATDSWKRTAVALPLVLEAIERAGLETVAV
jgi:peptidoglycan/xylan/chitin deacetylase (PgdA/CDA1 family)